MQMPGNTAILLPVADPIHLKLQGTFRIPLSLHADVRKLCPLFDAIAAVTIALLPKTTPVPLALYPFFRQQHKASIPVFGGIPLPWRKRAFAPCPFLPVHTARFSRRRIDRLLCRVRMGYQIIPMLSSTDFPVLRHGADRGSNCANSLY